MPNQFEVVIDGELEEIQSLATDIDRWPALIPDVRYVDVYWKDEAQTIGKVTLRRPAPVSLLFQTRVFSDGKQARISFHGRLGSRIYQIWRFIPGEDERVTVIVGSRIVGSQWNLRARAVNRWLIEPFTVQLLEMITLLTESDRLAHLGITPN